MSRRIVIDPSKKAFVEEVDLPAAPKPPNFDSDSDFANMLNKTVEVLRREVTHLLMESSSGKLSKSSSTDLVNYIKLLNELHTKEKDILGDLSDEEIDALIEERDAKTKSDRTD